MALDEEESFPLSTDVEERWQSVFKKRESGGLYLEEIHFIDRAIANARSDLFDPNRQSRLTATDVARAEASHRIRLEAFSSAQRGDESIRTVLREKAKLETIEADSYNQFIIRTLTYGNGGAFLGVVAFLGTERGAVYAQDVVPFLVSTMLGAIAGLLSAYFLSLRGYELSARYLDGSYEFIGTSKMMKSFEWPRKVTVWRRIAMVLSWLSGVLLVFAAISFVFVLSGGWPEWVKISCG